MLSQIVGFEWWYQSRQLAFAGAAVLFFLLGFALTSTGFGPDNIAVTSPYLVTESLGFLSLLSVFAAAIFVSSAMLRDSDHRMEEIVFCTPVGRFDYLFGRFAGAFLATLATVGLSAAGMIVATFMPWLDPERAGSIDAAAYLGALAVVTVPNVLFVTAVLFAVAALTRSAVATYAAAVFVYALYLVGASLTNSPLMAASAPGAGGGALTALLDPFGLSSFFEATRYWSVVEKNERFVALEPALLVNRALWIGVAAAIWVGVYRAFSFRVMRRTKSKAIRRDTKARVRPAVYAPLATDRRAARSWIASYLSATRLELRTLAGSLPSLLLLLLWVLLAATEIRAEVFAGEYGSAAYPATGLVVGALRTPLMLVGTILVIYYSAELLWRERRVRMSAILDATPVHGSVMVASKWSALAALVVALVAGGIVAGVALQISAGYWRFEPALYLSLLYFAGVPLALFAAAAVFAHALSPGKYAGMVIVLLLAVFTQRAYMLGLEHHLWRFASAPAVRYTEMNGFGAHVASFHWYMLLWSAAGALLLLMAAGLWRGMGTSVRERVALLLEPSPAGRSLAVALAGVAIATGCWIFYNTDVLNARTTTEGLLTWKADYEREYRQFAELPQPSISEVETDVELYPEERRYRVAGRYALVNETSSAIETVLVAVRREARSIDLALASGRLVAADDRFGMYRFALDEPLAPGARTELRFDLSFESRGFVDDDPDETVVENGSFVMSLRCFPTLGYRKGYEIADSRERQRRGLAGPGLAPLEEGEHGAAAGPDLEWVSFAATVSTSGDQLVVAPGRLERRWERDGRRFFRFRTESPIVNRFVIASARYEVATRRHVDVDVEVYYDREHGANVERMLDAAVATLDYCTEQFGPYPHGELRLAEIPSTWEFAGLAMPGTIFLGEARAFLTDARAPGPVDLVARRVAHEVAHQWWGHRLAPVSAEGATALVESLTKYSELMVIERMYGREGVRRQLELELDRYLSGRSREEREEMPLYRVGDQPYIYYAKGAVVLYAIRDLIGEAAMSDALRGLLEEHGGAGGRATTLDLLSHLRRVAPERDARLIEEWMREIVLYDLELASADVARRDDGRYEVRVRVAAAKSRADGRGVESPLAMHETIGVAVFEGESILSSEEYDLRDGINELSIVVDRSPTAVAVDPYLSRIDKNRFDNRLELEK